MYSNRKLYKRDKFLERSKFYGKSRKRKQGCTNEYPPKA